MNTVLAEQLRASVDKMFFTLIATTGASPEHAGDWKALATEVVIQVLDAVTTLGTGAVTDNALGALDRSVSGLQDRVHALEAQLSSAAVEGYTKGKLETLVQIRDSLASFYANVDQLGRADLQDLTGMKRAVSIVEREIETSPTSVKVVD